MIKLTADELKQKLELHRKWLNNNGGEKLSGDKIIQLVIVPCYTPELELVSELEETERGDNGFGSTGR